MKYRRASSAWRRSHSAQLDSFSIYQPSIIDAVKLPDWKEKRRMAWASAENSSVGFDCGDDDVAT
jgi:hypothetical protein